MEDITTIRVSKEVRDFLNCCTKHSRSNSVNDLLIRVADVIKERSEKLHEEYIDQRTRLIKSIS